MTSKNKQRTQLPSLYFASDFKGPMTVDRSSNRSKQTISNRDFIIVKANSHLPSYQPLADRHLQSFIQKTGVRKQLQKAGLVKREATSVEVKPLGKLSKIEIDLKHSYGSRKKERAQTHLTGRKAVTKEELERYIQQVRNRIIANKFQPD